VEEARKSMADEDEAEEEEEDEAMAATEPLDRELRFVEWQYKSLRKEIDRAESEIFKLLAGGIAVIPVAQGLGTLRQIDVITIVIPFIIIVLAMHFTERNRSVMRCGRFIKEYIEPHFPTVKGWESWLEELEQRRREPEANMIGAFQLLFLVYYIVSVALVIDFWLNSDTAKGVVSTLGLHQPTMVMFFGIIYIALGIAASYFVLKETITNTTDA
jgi:hypothetical protein